MGGVFFPTILPGMNLVFYCAIGCWHAKGIFCGNHFRMPDNQHKDVC